MSLLAIPAPCPMPHRLQSQACTGTSHLIYICSRSSPMSHRQQSQAKTSTSGIRFPSLQSQAKTSTSDIRFPSPLPHRLRSQAKRALQTTYQRCLQRQTSSKVYLPAHTANILFTSPLQSGVLLRDTACRGIGHLVASYAFDTHRRLRKLHVI